MKFEIINYKGWKNCVRLSNNKIELIATTDVGPRIIRFGFLKGENLFKEVKSDLGSVGGKKWKLYGGHRLWHAPEHKTRTYWPDNVPVKYQYKGKKLRLIQQVEACGIQKEIELSMSPSGKVTLVHVLRNKGTKSIELAPWCLTVMKENTRVILPQEKYIPHPQYLLAARPLVLWHYTDMSDSRFTWGKKYIQVQQNPRSTTKQKIGLLNKANWAAGYVSGVLFIKKYAYDSKAEYPDYGCNTEVYTDSGIVEIETLGSLSKILPGKSVKYEEVWSLHKTGLGISEKSIDNGVLKYVR